MPERKNGDSLMKSILAAAAAALVLAGSAGSADAQWRRGRTTVIEQAPAGVDLNTVLLLGALGGGGTGLEAVLPLLALQNQGTTTVIERGRRWRGPRPAPSARLAR